MTRNDSPSARRSTRLAASQNEATLKNQSTLTSYFARSKSTSSRTLSKSALLNGTHEITGSKQDPSTGRKGVEDEAGSAHATPKQRAKGRRLSISPKSSTSLRNKLSKLKHELAIETKVLDIPSATTESGIGTDDPSAVTNDLATKKMNTSPEIVPKASQSTSTAEAVSMHVTLTKQSESPVTLPEEEALELESGDVTARINKLEREASSADVSLKAWITEHKTCVDRNKQLPEQHEEAEQDEPPPLDDIAAQPILMTKPVIPVLLTPHALAIAERLGIPRGTLRLAIPQAISFLEMLLGNIDSIVCLALSRAQPAVFAKLVRPLELMLGKRVTPDHVSQISFLWPEAYKTEPCRVIHDGKRVQSFRFQLSHLFSHEHLLERRVQFRWNSVKFVDREHRKHLQALGIEPVAVEKLQSWHKSFDLESITVPVERSGPREEEPAEKALPLTQPVTPIHKQTVQSTPSTLLERIKAKQQLLLQQQMLVKPKLHQEHANHLLSLVDRITVLYTSCNKTTLPLAQVQSRLNLSAAVDGNGKGVIGELCSLVPEWIQMLHTDDVKGTGPLLVRVDRSMPIRGVRDKISKLLQAKETSNE